MITKTEIREATAQLASYTGLPIHVQWAYGHPRLHIDEGTRGGIADLSPRLPNHQLMDWIIAFSKGFEYGLKGR